MLRRMDRVDYTRVLRRMIPRRWLRVLGVALIAVMWWRPDLVVETAWWFWEGRAQRMVEFVTDAGSPSDPPTGLTAPTIPDPPRADALTGH